MPSKTIEDPAHIEETVSGRRHRVMILLAFAAIYVIWGTTYGAMRVAVETIPPFLMAGTRFLLAGVGAFIVLRRAGIPNPGWPQWRAGARVGCLLIVGGNGLVTWSEQKIPSGIAALVVATMPLWMVLFDRLFYSGPRLRPKSIGGLLLGTCGLILLFGPATLRGGIPLDRTSLIVLMFAPVFWSLGSLQSRNASLPDNALMSATVQMITGGAALFAIAIVMGEPWHADYQAMSVNSLLAMLYLSVCGSFVALSAYLWLLKHVPAAHVATYTYVNPVIAVFLGWLLLGETVSGSTVIASAAIVSAVVLIVAGDRTTRHRPERTSERTSKNLLEERRLAICNSDQE